jgi:REP element-mobilizing transposase RayT
MDSFNPGNANLPIGGGNRGKSAIQENGRPRGNTGQGVWHSRRYIPHFEGAEAIQHVTFHLADSLPRTTLLRIEAEMKTVPAEKRDAERRQRMEAWIDAGHGSCLLRRPDIAGIAQGALLAFDSLRYHLLAWVVMPNHVNVLFQPINGWTVAKAVASWKKFTARRICDSLRNNGKEPAPVWHREYWDRYIRDRRHFQRAIGYIHENPVKAGLVARAENWRWSSAFVEDQEGANREIGVPRGNP